MPKKIGHKLTDKTIESPFLLLYDLDELEP